MNNTWQIDVCDTPACGFVTGADGNRGYCPFCDKACRRVVVHDKANSQRQAELQIYAILQRAMGSLREIAGEDYRGPRPSGALIAERALDEANAALTALTNGDPQRPDPDELGRVKGGL